MALSRRVDARRTGGYGSGVISVGEALALVLEDTPRLGTERVPLADALGRVAAEDVASARAVPADDNSAMDGYAVRGADLTGPGVRLRVVGVAPAGTVAATPLAPGTAWKIFTGSVVPPGADTVVKVEDTDGGAGEVTIVAPPARGANVRHAGEDIAVGAVVVRAGTGLGPADLGVLASVGRSSVQVVQRPRVAIVSTGAELIEIDATPAPGQVVNSNAASLAAAVVEAGGVPVVLPIVRDRREDIRAALAEAARADVVLSSGGVSVGDFDFVKEEFDALGVARRFWKVAQKPGKPLTFGRRDRTLFFGLPGNPVSALVCFLVYVRPALRKMAGHAALHLPTVDARLAAPVRTAPALTEFVRVRLTRCDGEWAAEPFPSQSSGVLTSMSAGAGLLVARPGAALVVGDRYPVIVPAAVTLETVDPASAVR